MAFEKANYVDFGVSVVSMNSCVTTGELPNLSKPHCSKIEMEFLLHTAVVKRQDLIRAFPAIGRSLLMGPREDAGREGGAWTTSTISRIVPLVRRHLTKSFQCLKTERKEEKEII